MTARDDYSLDQVLEDIQVAEVDECHIEAVREQNKGPIDGLDGWWMVSDERRGVFAYFATDTEACAYRLFLWWQRGRRGRVRHSR